LNSNYWTFPVPGTDNVVVTPPDSEGLVLLSPIAAWIWQNQQLPDLAAIYADHFGIPLAQAEADIRQVLSPGNSVTVKINQKTFQIQLDTEALAEEVLPRLGDLVKTLPHQLVDQPDHTLRLHQTAHATLLDLDGVHLATEPLITAARAQLLQELTRLAEPGRRITTILHAGAVGTPNAAAILAGPSFSGKSTLCAALLQAGLLCLGDDSACLTPTFDVAGMPFALSLREGSWPLFPHLHQPRFLPSNLNGTSPAIPATRLIFVNYQPDAVSTTFDPVPTFDALVALNQSGFWVEHTQPSISAFLAWLARIPIHRLTYSSLPDAVTHVTRLLSPSPLREGL
jgi:hypothetical protein